MKAKQFFTAGRLAVLAFTCIATLSITACSSDDDDTGGKSANELVGLWTREFTLYGKQATESYQFNANGTGRYDSSAGTWATFTYKITAKEFVSMKMEYQYGSDIWRESHNWCYYVNGKTLSLNSKRFTRK